MAGFEIVVRPVVFPDIRPAPAQPVPPADDPEKGFATISGNGGHQFSTSSSYSASASSSQRTETQRRVDEVRVYQKKGGGSSASSASTRAASDSGSVNRKNFVDIEVVNKVWMKGPPSQKTGDRPSFGFAQGPMAGGTESVGPEKNVFYYQRTKAQDNIEIRKRDVIKKADE